MYEEDPYERPYYQEIRRLPRRRGYPPPQPPPQEPEEGALGGKLMGGALAFGLGAATVLVLQKFWRQIARTAVTGAVRTQQRMREVSAEVMEDLEDVWAEQSQAKPEPPETLR
ncbi:MAG TPA: hypothetical protein VMW27_05295 [Thermoanaerobaculia bacterium]|nr:hypothetical protein [Thermoanaerobaculia bacterium]